MPNDRSDPLEILRNTWLLAPDWYLETYPDVAHANMEPAAHYLLYGAAIGRNPGPFFDTDFYVETHGAAIPEGVNPLVHYIVEGAARGLGHRLPDRQALRDVQDARTRLWSLGTTDAPLADLARIADGRASLARAQAARELALWHVRRNSPDGYRAALAHVDAARADAPHHAFRCTLTVIAFMCHYFSGNAEEAAECHERAALDGEMSPDAMLAWASCQPRLDDRVFWINQALGQHGIPAVTLGEGRTPYDRLAVHDAGAAVVDGPKVTVLIAAFDAAKTLPTALRSLQTQTWRNLEIIVIDDCSPDGGATVGVAHDAAARDPRIRVIGMDTNGGAYMARNRGLDAATGDFLTLHDADDWSHPLKIETQMRFMRDNPDVMGCTSEQARASEDLVFLTSRGSGLLTMFNASSFLFRRAPVRAELGYWDTVRFGADNELIRRVQRTFGKTAHRNIATGPLSFPRSADSSITRSTVMGIDAEYHGVRREYHDAQVYHHRTAPLKYGAGPACRPFPVPAMMRPDHAAPRGGPRIFDLVVMGDFRDGAPALDAFLDDLAALRGRYATIGLVECFPEDHAPGTHAICDRLRAEIDGTQIQVLVHGDTVRAKCVLGLDGATPAHVYAPEIHEMDGSRAASA